jgi:hypothetical protein
MNRKVSRSRVLSRSGRLIATDSANEQAHREPDADYTRSTVAVIGPCASTSSVSSRLRKELDADPEPATVELYTGKSSRDNFPARHHRDFGRD